MKVAIRVCIYDLLSRFSLPSTPLQQNNFDISSIVKI